MHQDTFLNYRRFKWLWITAAALVAMLVLYVVDNPLGGRSGGSLLGYAYGILAAVGIVWLMAFGLRKRSYHSSLGTLEGWLAAHVWIGIGLLLVVPLHAAFSFGCNVHTLAYVLMVLTILTGIWGAVNYSTLSGRITAHRGGAKDELLVERVDELQQQAGQLCAGKSDAFVRLYNEFCAPFKPSLAWMLFTSRQPVVDKKAAREMLSRLEGAEHTDAVAMIGLLDQRLDMLRELAEQARIKALLKLWLYVHVPASFALCVALIAHILSVLYFR